jgi:hypothetical protein
VAFQRGKRGHGPGRCFCFLTANRNIQNFPKISHRTQKGKHPTRATPESHDLLTTNHPKPPHWEKDRPFHVKSACVETIPTTTLGRETGAECAR